MGTITKDFSYHEFERSATADKLGIRNVINTFEVRDAVKALAETVLQPLRDAWGKPIVIRSGWRCAALNKAVGGSPTSAHATGYAADIVPEDGSVDTFFAFVRKWLVDTGTKFDQCALEIDSRINSKWVHIGMKGPNGRQLGKFYNWIKK